MRAWYRFWFFTVAGWKISGDVPRHLNKYIIAVAPHSSNWDFLIGLAVRSIMRFKSNFLGKKELFKAPFGWLFRKLGGYPIDRKKSENKVDQVVQVIQNQDYFVVAIAPEGTRKKVDRWKTGFYHIAFNANIPIVFCALDYQHKEVVFREPFFPSGNLNQDSAIIGAFFKGRLGKNRSAAPVLGS